MLRPKRRRSVLPLLGTGVIVLGLIGLFAVSVYAFRSKPKPTEEPAVSPLLEGILEPHPVHVTSESLGEGARQAELVSLDGSGAQGIATRGEKDGHFYFTVRTTLGAIDRETQTYEVWLIQELPYDFFRVGEMVTNEEGAFIFDWEAAEGRDGRGTSFTDYAGYTNVIITREGKDGNPDPGLRVMDGTFRVF